MNLSPNQYLTDYNLWRFSRWSAMTVFRVGGCTAGGLAFCGFGGAGLAVAAASGAASVGCLALSRWAERLYCPQPDTSPQIHDRPMPLTTTPSTTQQGEERPMANGAESKPIREGWVAGTPTRSTEINYLTQVRTQALIEALTDLVREDGVQVAVRHLHHVLQPLSEFVADVPTIATEEAFTGGSWHRLINSDEVKLADLAAEVLDLAERMAVTARSINQPKAGPQ